MMRDEIRLALTQKRLKGMNTDCRYYPCHFDGMDCTWCFCPFYPCQDTTLGKMVTSKRTGKPVWSCMGCSWVHNPKTAKKILEGILGSSPGQISNISRKELLSIFSRIRSEVE
jgi:Zn-finger protein